MTLKDFVLKKRAEILKISEELDKKYNGKAASIEALRDYSKNNGRYEVISDILSFILLNEAIDKAKKETKIKTITI